MLSHTYIKKINLSLSKILSQNNNLDITCVVPKKIFQGDNEIYPDYKKSEINLKLIRSKLINKSIRTQYFEKIGAIIRNERPDIIFLDNDTVCLQSLILIYWSFFFKFRLFYFCNENNLINIFLSFSIKKFIKFLVIGISNIFIKSRIERIFCYSSQIKKNYDFFGYKKKTTIVPLGYDKDIFFFKRSKKRKKIFKISYFGRVTYSKGIHVLIESLKKLKNYQWHLIIDIDHIEDRQYFIELKNELKKNFSRGRYTFIKCDHFEIANYMRMSNVVVLPSLHEEQYGRVIQEAIACGNVAVGSKIGAIPEIIKDKNLLFEPGNYQKLSLILKRLFNRRYYMKKFNKQFLDINKNRSLQKQAELILKFL